MTVVSRRAWLGTACALAATGCMRPGGDALRFWAMGREGEVVGGLLDAFAHGIALRVEKLPWSAAHEKLLTAFAGDATPDVAQLGNTWIAELAALDALLPLEGADAGDHFEGIWQTNVVDGVRYGVPWYVDTRLVFYRRDLFERAGVGAMPTDWAGFARALDALQRAGIRHPLLLPINEYEPLLAFALQGDDPLLRDGGRYGNFRSAGFVRALGYYLERFARGHAPTVAANQISNLWQEFGRGTFAAYISGPWNIGELERRLPPALQDRWATAPLPGPHGPGASIAGGSSLVVFRRSRRADDAMRLLALLGRPDVQLRFHGLTGNLPPRRSTWALEPLASDRHAAAFAAQLERAKATPAVPEWERIAQEMQLVAARAVHERLAAADAAALVDARVDAFLAKRRWMLDRAGGRA